MHNVILLDHVTAWLKYCQFLYQTCWTLVHIYAVAAITRAGIEVVATPGMVAAAAVAASAAAWAAAVATTAAATGAAASAAGDQGGILLQVR